MKIKDNKIGYICLVTEKKITVNLYKPQVDRPMMKIFT